MIPALYIIIISNLSICRHLAQACLDINITGQQLIDSPVEVLALDIAQDSPAGTGLP